MPDVYGPRDCQRGKNYPSIWGTIWINEETVFVKRRGNIDLPAITLQFQFIAWAAEGQIDNFNLTYVAEIQNVT